VAGHAVPRAARLVDSLAGMVDQKNRGGTPEVRGPIDILRNSPWQMSYGERAALEGLLAECRPSLAIELGTAEGGSLERIALHSTEVHSFDLVEPQPHARELPNVTFHIGDSHEVLGEVLEQFAAQGRNVDLALVDGDHSTAGVRQDMEDLLNSPAIGDTLILMHDTINEVVRTGLEETDLEAWPKVVYVELDLVAGHLFRDPAMLGELWGGLGLVVTSRQPRAADAHARQRRYFDAYRIVKEAREAVLDAHRQRNRLAVPADELPDEEPEYIDPAWQRDQYKAELEQTRAELAHHLMIWHRTMNSFSWRVTRPLRGAKARLARLLH
jgi:Methyltransferase domain